MKITSRGGKRYVLFEETNSVVGHDTQEEEFELGLVRKDLSLSQSSIVDKGKAPKGEPSPRTNNLEGGQGANQSGESITEPEQNWPTQPHYSPTDIGTGTRVVPEPVLPSTQERLVSVSVDSSIPRPWKH